MLLLSDIKDICNIIEQFSTWDFDACKHYIEDREKEPLLFTYQSVHYILNPKEEIIFKGITVPTSTTCEVQIRTLLQHAHDAIYKSKRTIVPKVQRTVAKSMALIETTDDFFTDVTQELNSGPLEELHILDQLDNIYTGLTGIKPRFQKSSIVVWDEFEQFIDENLIGDIQTLISKYSFLPERIKEGFSENIFYQQSTVLFIYWLLKRRRQRLLRDWPLKRELLQPFANDLGISTWDE